MRQLFGYERLENRDFVSLMNAIYRDYANPLTNFFIPCVRLIEKIRVGGKIKKKYDLPKTPYQRLLESSDLSEEAKEELRKKYQSLNPFLLRQGLQEKMSELWQQHRRLLFHRVG